MELINKNNELSKEINELNIKCTDQNTKLIDLD